MKGLKWSLIVVLVVLTVALLLPAATWAASSIVTEQGATLLADAQGDAWRSPDVFEYAYVFVDGQKSLTVYYQRQDNSTGSWTFGGGSVELSPGQVEWSGGGLKTLVIHDVVVPLLGQGFPTGDPYAVVSLTFTGVGEARTDVVHQATQGYGIYTLVRRTTQASLSGSVYVDGVGTISGDFFTSNAMTHASGAAVMPPNGDD